VSIRVGTSGWQYADWRHAFYEGRPQRLWLTAYADTFDTVEVNATFYRLPMESAVQRWVDQVPANFVFAVKASRYLTHIKRLREPAEPVARLLARIQPLATAGMLGPVLLQFPPDMPAVPALLDATLAEFPSQVRLAVEPRHQSWFETATRDVLERRGAALVWADRDGQSLGPLWETTNWCYLRLHHGRQDWGYDERDLARWTARVAAVGEGYVYLNNDPGAAAVRDAATFRRLLADRPGRRQTCPKSSQASESHS
jgi:uncharacterized protein YecE (DUF72 family)